jgi:hypothetical protein
VSISLTDLSNYVFVYIAGKVIPTVPPEFVIFLVKRCARQKRKKYYYIIKIPALSMFTVVF